jgi:[histone H3]-trimethyl-L-lysine4 demethylase
LKIARGKVKDDDKYTCPICDWRVKIPRDAARPKLEDLQAWQDEIIGLPFQPDEEGILDKIINNAQDFRNHVAPFCNPMMATSEEAEVQRFYLRKIEGAEILLAYETNFFRQELHKWSPVAPEPPPVLENSKSTRKPRPTKLQKLMAQHGVDDPENLPAFLRAKQMAKRKSSEPTSLRPQPLQPAPDRSDSGTPTSQRFPVSGPQAFHHGPILTSMAPDQHPQPSFSFDAHLFSMPSSQSSTPAFAQHGFQPPPFVSNSPGASNMDPGIFTGAALARSDPALGVSASLESPMRDSFGVSSQGAGANANMDEVFNDLTNQDDDGLGNSQSDAAGRGSSTSPTLRTSGESRINTDKEVAKPQALSYENMRDHGDMFDRPFGTHSPSDTNDMFEDSE